MAESSRVIIVGIPGVGKTTLVEKLVEMLRRDHKTVNVVSFGTVMLDEAKKRRLVDRDQLRRLPMAEQQALQMSAAESISRLSEDYVIIDTHTFISTPSGHYPGLTERMLKVMRPSSFVSVYARPEDIYNRRMKDETRNRDRISIDGIKKELSLHESMLSACSVISGSPIRSVLNSEGKVDEAARQVIGTVGLDD